MDYDRAPSQVVEEEIRCVTEIYSHFPKIIHEWRWIKFVGITALNLLIFQLNEYRYVWGL